MSKLVSHLRHNAIAYLALFVALGGTSYAAYSLPAGSVGTRQLRNHAIEPVKLNRSLIGGYIRAWAHVGAGGHLLGSSPGVKISTNGIAPGFSIIDWHQSPHSGCEVLASVDLRAGTGAPNSPGYVVATVGYYHKPDRSSIVQTFDPGGQPTSLPYDAALICNTPR
jgi:hypothetical protein